MSVHWIVGDRYPFPLAMARIHWTRRLRSIVSSVADITGDWFFYDYVAGLTDEELDGGDQDGWRLTVLAIATISTIIGLANILTNLCGFQTCGGRATICGLVPTKIGHLLETVLEDIPQVAVSALIARELKGTPLSAQSVFNLTTSGINFFLDALDIFEPVLPDLDDDKKNDGDPQEGYSGTSYVRASPY